MPCAIKGGVRRVRRAGGRNKPRAARLPCPNAPRASGVPLGAMRVGAMGLRHWAPCGWAQCGWAQWGCAMRVGFGAPLGAMRVGAMGLRHWAPCCARIVAHLCDDLPEAAREGVVDAAEDGAGELWLSAQQVGEVLARD
eukprot:7035248-Prymnesium_polylepis.1